MRPGDRVRVYGRNPRGRRLLEGEAQLIGRSHGVTEGELERWIVKFDNPELRPVRRYVHPSDVVTDAPSGWHLAVS